MITPASQLRNASRLRSKDTNGELPLRIPESDNIALFKHLEEAPFFRIEYSVMAVAD